MSKINRLALLLPMLVLAGCYNGQQTTIVQKPQPIGRARGIDLATDAGQVAHRVKDTGLHFVARYYRKPDSRWPTLSANEARLISSLGLNLVTVWESHSQHRNYFTYSRGYWDAMAAAQQAKAVGQPAGSAIYFAVDFDARGADIIPVDQYFRGITSGLAAASGAEAVAAGRIYLAVELDRLGRVEQLCRVEHPAGSALRSARLHQPRFERGARRLRRVPARRTVTLPSALVLLLPKGGRQ